MVRFTINSVIDERCADLPQRCVMPNPQVRRLRGLLFVVAGWTLRAAVGPCFAAFRDDLAGHLVKAPHVDQ